MEEYLGQVVFYQERPFTQAQFRRFMFAQSKPYPEMIKLVTPLKVRRFGDTKHSPHRLQVHVRQTGCVRIAEWRTGHHETS
jgi:hypothetical protein